MPPRVVPSVKPLPSSVPSPSFSPFWMTKDGETVRLYLGHVTDVLSKLPAGIVQTVVTSPPYWGLRSYLKDDHEHKRYELGSEPSPDCGTHGQAQCGRCFVCGMVAVFRGVRRVLRDDGTLWLNLGDTYAQNVGKGFGTNQSGRGKRSDFYDDQQHKVKTGLPSGNLVGVPWRVALALQADGWVLRQDIIWHKPSPMPESVQNRCTKAHEYVFLLTKRGSGYYYDTESIKEPLLQSEDAYRRMLESKQRQNSAKLGTSLEAGAGRKTDGFNSFISDGKTEIYVPSGRNKRSVWTIASQGYEGAHFATFPPKLIAPMILAGTSARGCCSKCGTPWKRVVIQRKLTRERPNDYVKRTGEEGTGNSCSNSVAGVEVRTVGWEPTCTCFGRFEERTVEIPRGEKLSHPVGGVKYTANGDHGQSRQNGPSQRNRTVKVREYVCSCGVRWGLAKEEKEPTRGKLPEGKDPEQYKTYEETDNYVPNPACGFSGTKSDRPEPFRSVERDDPCGCYGPESGRVVPCVVLDPFVGSGTSCVVSLEHGRWSWGIDLSETYLRNNATPRVEGYLLSVPSLAALAGRETKKVMIGKVMTMKGGKR